MRLSYCCQLLLCLSSLLAAAAVIVLALFKQFGHNWSLGIWCERYLPIVLLDIQLLFVSFGLYPLAAVVSSEVLPTKVSQILQSLSGLVAISKSPRPKWNQLLEHVESSRYSVNNSDIKISFYTINLSYKLGICSSEINASFFFVNFYFKLFINRIFLSTNNF